MNTDGDDLETQWSTFKDTVFDTAKSVLGYSKRKQPDWFDESNHEIKDLLAKRRATHNACLNDKSSQKKRDQYRWLRSQAQSKIRNIKDAWWADKAVELQGYADQHATKLFFSGLKAVYGPTSKNMTPIRAEDGTLLIDKAHILERWSTHFNQLLNKVSSVEEQAISNIRRRSIILALDGWPTVAETQKAIDQLQTGKAPSADVIPPEIYKMGGLALAEHLTGIFQSFWRKGELTQISCTCTRTKVINLYVIITGVSPSSALQARS